MQCTEIFLDLKIENFQLKNFDIFLVFAQNIDCGYTNRFAEAVLTSTHNLCFGAKIRKIGIPLHTQFYYIKVRFEGVYFTRTCFPDVFAFQLITTVLIKCSSIFVHHAVVLWAQIC